MSGQISNNKGLSRTAAQQIASHVSGMHSAGLSTRVIEAVQNFTLDTIGVGIAGRRSPYAAGVLKSALGWGGGQAGHVFGEEGVELPPQSAAFVNAFQAHALEFDCVHEGAVLHPLTVVVPVLLAEAERASHAGIPLSGPDFIAACAAGIDVAAGLGIAAVSQIKFFRPATCGLFGATAALARARQLSAEQTAHALGYALAFASGTMQAHVEGTPALAASVGAAARSAFTAVDLAQAGLPGPMGSIDGPFGYLTLFEDRIDLGLLLDHLGTRPRTLEVSWKPFPTGRAAHGGIDMILQLAGQGLTAHNLDHLVIHAPPLIHHLVGRPIVPAPLEVNYARLCLPYVGAVALHTGGVTLCDFTPDRLNDPVTHRLAQRIEVRHNQVESHSAFVPQTAVATLNDGSVLQVSIEALIGSPARPLLREQHLAKFRACLSYGFGASHPDLEDGLITACDHLATLSDTSVLPRLSAGLEPLP
jgi:2-methylcitrate dehydratase PrpD